MFSEAQGRPSQHMNTRFPIVLEFIAFLIVAIISPILSSIADYKGNKKKTQIAKNLIFKLWVIELSN